MRKNIDTIFEWLIKAIIFLICLACIYAMASCRILKSHKSKNSTILDSTHQVINKSQNGIHQDSTAHSDKKDSTGKQTLWNYEKEKTKTVEYFQPAKVDSSAGPQLIKRVTTTTKQRGQVQTLEAHANSDRLDVILSNTDTSTVDQSQSTHLQKGSTNQVNDRSVKSLPAWLIIATVLVSIIMLWVWVGDPIAWIAALFKRKKNR